MSSFSPAPLSKINIPLIVLWLASVIVAVLGYLLMTSSNSDQVAIYTSGEADYAKLFVAQSGGTVGGLLIAVGVLGVLLALAAQAITQRRVVTPEAVVPDAAARAAEPTDEDLAEEAPVAELETAATDAAEPDAAEPDAAEPVVETSAR